MKIQWKKVICSIIIGIVLAGEVNIPVNVAAAATVNQSNQNLQCLSTNTYDLAAQVSSLLGVLEQKVTVEERNTISGLISKIDNLQDNREASNIYVPTNDEQRLTTQLCSYLDGLTLKYINGAKQALEYGSGFKSGLQLPENNVIINNLKQTLSTADYKKITKLYNQYRKESKDDYFDKIYSILSKYKSLDVDAVFYNIIGADMPMKGQFKINQDDLSLKYMNPKKYGLTKLTEKQIKKYQKVWSMVKQILPPDYFSQFIEFDIASDGEYGTMAYVLQMDKSGKTWKLCIDPADMEDKTNFALTIIHEYSHYLSLNNNQVKYFAADQSLMPSFDDYTDNEVVANEDSYLNDFYQEFWSGIEDDWSADTDNVLFYVRHYDEFVTEYAATQCAEDFSETFSYYVLGKEDATVDQQKKIDFFDQYPKLKQMKQEILENIKKNNYDTAISQ